MYDIDVSPDGKLIAVAKRTIGVRLLNARTGKKCKTQIKNHKMTALHVVFSPTIAPQTLLVVSALDGILRVYDCSSGACVAELEDNDNLLGCCTTFSPDGRLLASGSYDGGVQLWRTDNWHAPPAVLNGHIEFVVGVSFSCDGRLLASCSDDRTVRLWHISNTTATAGPVLNVDHPVWCVAFSPVDSRLLACCGETSNVVLARVGDGAIGVERHLQGHTDEVLKLAFSPCGQTLASSSRDTIVRLWSVVSGVCLRVLQGHTSGVTDVTFFHSGKQLVTGCFDGTVRIWTTCAWSDHNHHLFGMLLKHTIFQLMCVRARLEQTHGLRRSSRRPQLPRLPIELWLMVFEQLAVYTEI